MVDWYGLIIPSVYLVVLIGSLVTFSSLYRKRKIAKAASLEPWFPPHLQRNIYLSLLHLEPESQDKKPPQVPESVLKAALLRRATVDIHRLLEIRNSKQAITTLLQRGSVGDDLWQRYQRADQEINEELRDVVNEANAFAPNWGQILFQTANEMAQNALLRQKVEEIQSQVQSEREWWDKKRATTREEFLKEIEGSPQPQKTGVSGEKGGSEDDAVLVEAGVSAANIKNSTKKKKGKK